MPFYRLLESEEYFRFISRSPELLQNGINVDINVDDTERTYTI